jgi:hypothetical protein
MPSRVLVHFPEPAAPALVELSLPSRPNRGEEFPTGWTVCDLQLVPGELEGLEFAFEVWVMPRSAEPSEAADCWS